ncbi:MAG TPA: aldehyde dehydrogenase family protein [Syntrophobacteraceae bacterium]|nr:aldehyde dehydrogenase family protein [Syntrophobacteraceae bacterium]
MKDLLERLAIGERNQGAFSGLVSLDCSGKPLESISPIDGKVLAKIIGADADTYDKVVQQAQAAFLQWRDIPSPKRGEAVRRIGAAFREWKNDLGALISIEMGKIRAEGEGEVQELIDMCDFAVGQSRMLYGFSMHSERPGHRMFEQYHPLGPIGVITAFNFPVAVWAWNAMLALIAGDTVVWKPSSKVPLCAIAANSIASRVIDDCGYPQGLLSVVIGAGEEIGGRMASDKRLPLISATGSVPMGRRVGQAVLSRLGKVLLELGGNNAVIVTPSADKDLAVRAVLFGAVGTAGQRCTTIRRLIVHNSIFDDFKERLISAYRQLKIGNPLEDGVLMGPLIDSQAVEAMREAIEEIKKQGGTVLYGGESFISGIYDAGTYVLPCICEVENSYPTVKKETFAPLLYMIRYGTIEEAVELQNDVPQGLTSSIFTNDLRESEFFLGSRGSDCGIANVNMSTSGAEIGGAFGGEKESGGGRESGSDSWKAYMRRQTCTINWSGQMPLAQGIKFGES